MNNENLTPINKRSPEERYAITSAGGKARAEQRRERKRLREALEIALNMVGEDGKKNIESITAGIIKRAKGGDPKAYEVIRDTVGEKPSNEVALTNQVSFKVELRDD